MRGQTGAFPDYSEYSTPHLLAAFAEGWARMRQAIDGLTDEEVRARPCGPDRWSIHEIVIHTTDSELQGTFRIRKAWSEPPSTLPIYNQDIWAREIDYQGDAPEARERALTMLQLLRELTLPLFRRATDEDWEKSGTHPEFGPVTLRNLLELYADHVERHIDQILESRGLLGRPLDMPHPLPRRLY